MGAKLGPWQRSCGSCRTRSIQSSIRPIRSSSTRPRRKRSRSRGPRSPWRNQFPGRLSASARRSQDEVRQAAEEGVLGRALGGLLGREEGSLPQLQRPLLPASSEQGLRQGDGEAAEGGLHPRGHQDEDQGGRVVVKWISRISTTFRMLYFNV